MSYIKLNKKIINTDSIHYKEFYHNPKTGEYIIVYYLITGLSEKLYFDSKSDMGDFIYIEIGICINYGDIIIDENIS